ncbi:lysozyme [Hoeflea sp.]|uniref:lysozyme n=1 Tax=Hoeflea sp. TaxID=1940281 RepID=UPI0019C701ED|nr:lysozyme [Hoeflea sp.]MBC7286128.1 lysozyme [Hoeflea sp.]
MMRVSDKGLLEIAEHEGIVPAPYRDSRGIWTFGIGHTAAAGAPDPREMGGAMPVGADLDNRLVRAIEVFRSDISKYERRVNSVIKVPLKQHQFDALVSWDFNTGGALWMRSDGKPAKLIQQINSGDMSGDGFMGWTKPASITRRRKKEMHLFRTGDYAANGDKIPVWRTDGLGNLIGVSRTVSGAWLLEQLGRAAKPPAPTGLWAQIVALVWRIFGIGR